MTTETLTAPQARVLCVLHEFGPLALADVARASGMLWIATADTLRELEIAEMACYQLGRGWVSTGRWWPGEPSLMVPAR